MLDDQLEDLIIRTSHTFNAFTSNLLVFASLPFPLYPFPDRELSMSSFFPEFLKRSQVSCLLYIDQKTIKVDLIPSQPSLLKKGYPCDSSSTSLLIRDCYCFTPHFDRESQVVETPK